MNKQQKVRREMERHRMANYIVQERQDVFIQSILIIMYTFEEWLQKRTMEFIEKFLTNMTDFKLGKYFTREMLIETLEKELNLNMDQFIKSEVAKCYERFQKGA